MLTVPKQTLSVMGSLYHWSSQRLNRVKTRKNDENAPSKDATHRRQTAGRKGKKREEKSEGLEKRRQPVPPADVPLSGGTATHTQNALRPVIRHQERALQKEESVRLHCHRIVSYLMSRQCLFGRKKRIVKESWCYR